MGTCAADECIREKEKRGLCNMHYKRWRKWGDPTVKHTNKSALDRFWPKVLKTESCWIWTKSINESGYGKFNSPAGYSNLAHRFAYQALTGSIPDDLPLDHLCRNRRCVNPEHLEPVALAENKRRGLNFRLANGMDNSCVNGHEYTPENTYVNPNKPNDIRCRRCAANRYLQRKVA